MSSPAKPPSGTSQKPMLTAIHFLAGPHVYNHHRSWPRSLNACDAALPELARGISRVSYMRDGSKHVVRQPLLIRCFHQDLHAESESQQSVFVVSSEGIKKLGPLKSWHLGDSNGPRFDSDHHHHQHLQLRARCRKPIMVRGASTASAIMIAASAPAQGKTSLLDLVVGRARHKEAKSFERCVDDHREGAPPRGKHAARA
jgi:hypothetical protein